MQIDGLSVIVTGGGSGLGEATARHFSKLGAKVIILDYDEARATTVAQEIGGVAVKVDVSDAAAVDAAIEKGIEAVGQVPRVAVNCAGIAPGARIVGREGEVSIETFEKTIGVNLFGSYNVMSHALRRMQPLEALADGERGVIINTASIAYEDGQMGQAAYAASKGAIAAMCLPAARELARMGVRVMAIAPGLFHTPMMEGLPEEVTQKITANVPYPARLGQPEEYARLAAHIVENVYLNGSTIRLDGAVRLPPK